MAKRQNTARDEKPGQLHASASSQSGGGDVKAEQRRVRPGSVSPEQLAREIEEARRLLNRGLSRAAEARLVSVIEADYGDPKLTGRRAPCSPKPWRCRGATTKPSKSCACTSPRTRAPSWRRRLRLSFASGLAWPATTRATIRKSIALLNATLARGDRAGQRHAARRGLRGAGARLPQHQRVHHLARLLAAGDGVVTGARATGAGWPKSTWATGWWTSYEGHHESALGNYEQALKIVGKRASPHMLGRIYANMGGICWFIKRPHDGIRYLEKAIHYYERTEQKVNAAVGYNNLGINLTLVGEWGRAQEALKRSLELAFEVDRHNAQVPMILNSLGELRLLHGRAGRGAESSSARRQPGGRPRKSTGTKGRRGARSAAACWRLATTRAHAKRARRRSALAEQIGDRQAICESRLLLAEAHLQLGDTDETALQLQKVAEQTTEAIADLAIAGAAQRIHGLLWAGRNDGARAIHHFSRSVSIFEMLGDRHSGALSHYELGMAYAAASSRSRAAEYFRRRRASSANSARALTSRARKRPSPRSATRRRTKQSPCP